MKRVGYLAILLCAFGIGVPAAVDAGGAAGGGNFPPSLESYGDGHLENLGDVLSHRAAAEPFNVVATFIFICAIIHTFLSSKFTEVAHRLEHRHEEKKRGGQADKDSVSLGAGVFHFLGEVEVVFGLWAVALTAAIMGFYDWDTTVGYMGYTVNYTEPLFVVVIMTLASTRPILKLAELMLWKIASFFGGMLAAWWLTILTVGPILGSFITEPAAMTISALLLAEKFYSLNPSDKFKYATIGLLFVNISVGGTLTHFAAPPVLMVATPWNWGMGFMFTTFGWKAVIGICLANALYYYRFRGELNELQEKYQVVRMQRELQSIYIKREDLEAEFGEIEEVVCNELGFTASFEQKCAEIKEGFWTRLQERLKGKDVDLGLVEEAFEQRFEETKIHQMRQALPGLLPADQRPAFRDPDWDQRESRVPVWVMLVHVLGMAWTVFNAHHPALFCVSFLFLLGFAQVTAPYQNRIDLKPALLVGFFLAGLVAHGGVQAWWIAPVLGLLTEVPLMFGATVLTAFNDNAAITYLSTLVPGFTDGLKYAVVAGAVTGGGLTVIANAPNPAGQSILKGFFANGVSPLGLLKEAVVPTIIMFICFLLLRF